MKPPTFRPLNDRVLVLPDPSNSVSPGGIHIPDQAKEKAMVGTVKATGPGRWEDGGFKEPQVKVGDRVIYGLVDGGVDVTIDRQEKLVIIESAILGVQRMQ